MKIERVTGYYLKLVIASGDGDNPGCKLHVVLWRWYIILSLPPIIKPDVLKVRGKFNYNQLIERSYGFYLFENHLNILYGRGDANFHRDEFGKEQRWSCFLPWTEWRHVRHSLYGLSGELIWSGDQKSYDEFYEVRESVVPKVAFYLKDFDGEDISATTFIEEREWHRGVGWFKWLAWFFAPKIRRSLDISFDKETGPRKGSWKGGTMGCGIDMNQGELHEAAFRRYCKDHNMMFIS